jgi:hypothetical protein
MVTQEERHGRSAFDGHAHPGMIATSYASAAFSRVISFRNSKAVGGGFEL